MGASNLGVKSYKRHDLIRYVYLVLSRIFEAQVSGSSIVIMLEDWEDHGLATHHNQTQVVLGVRGFTVTCKPSERLDFHGVVLYLQIAVYEIIAHQDNSSEIRDASTAAFQYFALCYPSVTDPSVREESSPVRSPLDEQSMVHESTRTCELGYLMRIISRKKKDL
ncbi:hypothetical protein NP233_g1639 [Leucocoprinus birnbaumii]|uniref:Uncharacterized protein n=1 Tax=Leucocoprinus birnbaumii TaxID=56174 RepID=A0AAD5W3P2_9AGAR|nr:hypothetical protein NP233_g1639 [Leucocoprinus birnbaumii]